MTPDSIHVLLVEPTLEAEGGLANFLRRHGMHVTAVAGRAGAFGIPAGSTFDALVLDLQIDGAGGLGLLRRIRARTPMPIVALAGAGERGRGIDSLELGADDFMPRPFEPRELVARLHAQMRRSHGPHPLGFGTRDACAWSSGRLVFDRERSRLLGSGGGIESLSRLECGLLRAFVDRPGQILSRERLLRLADGPPRRPSRAVDAAVAGLRGKLDASGARIRTVRGEGYVFVAAPSAHARSAHPA